jgi:two-component system sensor histidine kinase KdpD
MERFRPRWETPGFGWRLAAAIAGPALVTLLAIPESHPSTAIVALLYVLTVVVAARVGGLFGGIAASTLSFLALNFFFTPPLHTLAVGALEDFVALVVFLIVSVVVGVLFSSALAERSRAQRREMEARLLNRLATRLMSGESAADVLTGFARGVCEIFGFARCEVVTDLAETASAGTGEASLGEWAEVPVMARGNEVGTIRYAFEDDRQLGAEDDAILRSLATQLGLALDGLRLSLDVRRAELEAQASQLKAALFSGVTHDVKTPLAAIITSVTSLIDGSGFTEQERREHLDTIRQEADRLHRVVNNLLDVARLRAGALVAEKTPTAIEEVLESVVRRLRPLLAEREVDLRISDDIPDVPMDVVQIDQVLTNLIENAIKFSPAGSRITLAAVGDPHGVRVTVSDMGSGVPKEDRSRLFEPFETGGTMGSGTGLGLTIAKAIVVAHGGRIWVSEGPGGGAAFTFELPGVIAAAEEVTDAGTSAGR